MFLLVTCLLFATEIMDTQSQCTIVVDDYSLDPVSPLLTQELEQRGYSVAQLEVADLPERSQPGSVWVVPSIQRFPADYKQRLLAHLQAGGDLIALGGPAFAESVWTWEGGWQTEAEILSGVRATTMAIGMGDEDPAQWSHAASADMGAELAVSALDDSPIPYALNLRVARFDGKGWDNVGRELMHPLAAENNTLCFWAKADGNTDALVVELKEQDGSRWLTSVSISSEWNYRAIPANEFQFWPDASAPGRGGSGDQVQFGQVKRLGLGLATSHAPQPPGEHEIWVGDIGTAHLPFADAAMSPLILEGLSPSYKTYVTQGDSLRTSHWSPPNALPETLPWEGSLEVVSPIWRARGLGPSREAQTRWVPWVELHDDAGEYRGTLAAMVHSQEASWAYLGIQSEQMRANIDVVGGLLANLLDTMSHDLLLEKAGTTKFAYFTDQQQRLAITVRNRGGEPQDALIQYRVLSQDELVDEGTRRVTVPGRESASVSGALKHQPAGHYEIEVVLRWHGDAVDRIRQPFTVMEDADDPPDAFVRAEQGSFVLHGKNWKPHGVNFWPRFVTGQEPDSYWVGWLHPSHYDPVVVDWDLKNLARMGVNSVSIQYTAPEFAPALCDFLVRARRRNIRTNIYLDGCHPLHIRRERAEKLIRSARLGHNASVWAFDLAWEPVVGDQQARARFDAEWNAWVVDRYGSCEYAIEMWGFANRNEEGQLTGPTRQQLLEDGRWRVMVAAYRQFLDDRISQGYNAIRQVAREMAPYTLLGARTGYGGTGQPSVDARFPFDLISGAKHLDFTSPEGWGLRGDWPNFQAAGFTTAYARYAGNGKPVFWSEFGLHLYPRYTPELIEEQRSVYANMYRMILDSQANGSAAWWYPGGLRVDENSDYGLINPDGTPRPAFQFLAEVASSLPIPGELDTWIEVNRDLHPRGYSAMWQRHREEYLAQAQPEADFGVEAGATVGVRTLLTGRTTEDMPFIPIGIPDGELDRLPSDRYFPLRGLNAEWNWVEISADGNEWQRMHQGEQLAWNGALHMRASVGNTGEVTWSAGTGPRSVDVALLSSATSRYPLSAPVTRYGDAQVQLGQVLEKVAETTEIELAMVLGESWRFGATFRLFLIPAQRLSEESD